MNDMNNPYLQRSTKCIFEYGADFQVTAVGWFVTNIKVTNIKVDMKSVRSMVHVIQENCGFLLSYKTTCNLGLIDVKTKHLWECPRVGPKWSKRILI